MLAYVLSGERVGTRSRLARRLEAVQRGVERQERFVEFAVEDLPGHAGSDRRPDYLARMRANIARLLEMDQGLVNVKGKTHEAVDAVGQGLALEAHCVVLLAR